MGEAAEGTRNEDHNNIKNTSQENIENTHEEHLPTIAWTVNIGTGTWRKKKETNAEREKYLKQETHFFFGGEGERDKQFTFYCGEGGGG